MCSLWVTPAPVELLYTSSSTRSRCLLSDGPYRTNPGTHEAEPFIASSKSRVPRIYMGGPLGHSCTVLLFKLEAALVLGRDRWKGEASDPA